MLFEIVYLLKIVYICVLPEKHGLKVVLFWRWRVRVLCLSPLAPTKTPRGGGRGGGDN